MKNGVKKKIGEKENRNASIGQKIESDNRWDN